MTAFTKARLCVEYADKSDQELTQLYVELAKRAAALPAIATPENIARLEDVRDRMEAINSILKDRGEEKKNREAAETRWKKDRDKCIKDAWWNLKYSSSANGQLIVSILEDEPGLTISKIAAWCEELSAMETIEIENILNEMVREGSLSYKHGRYYVRQICTEKLIPENPANTIMKQILQSRPYWYMDREQTAIMAILQVLERKDTALCAASIEKEIRNYDKPSITRIERLCDDMCDDDFLSKEDCFGESSNVTLYFFRTLGTEQFEKPAAGKAFSDELTAKNYISENSTISVARRPSARQIENDKLKDCIIEKMIEQKKYGRTLFSVDETLGLLADNELASELTSIRCSALLSQLVDEERVKRTVDRRVAYFSLT